MHFVSVMRLGLLSAISARLARVFLANEDGGGRILTESGDYILME